MSRREEILTEYARKVEEIRHQKTPKSRELKKRGDKRVGGAAVPEAPMSAIPYAKEPYSIFIDRSEGGYTYDIDGNRYLDLCNCYSANVIGNANPRVVETVREAASKGLSFGLPQKSRDELAEMICERVPSVEKMWFLSSGTEGDMIGIRLARAFTGKDKILRMIGEYSGFYDEALATPREAGLELMTTSQSPARPGVAPREWVGIPRDATRYVLFAPFNDIDAAEKIIRDNKDDLALVITEGVLSNPGTIPSKPDFLPALFDAAKRYGILTMIDEVINFRLAYGGVGEVYNVKPDLECFGKAIGGGASVGGVGGRAEIMNLFLATKERAGLMGRSTFAGNPLTMVAGKACLEELTANTIAHINSLGEMAANGIRDIFKGLGIKAQVTGYGSLFSIHLTPEEVTDQKSRLTAAGVEDLAGLLQHSLINKGILLCMAPLKVMNLSTPMSEKDVQFLLAAIREVFTEVKPLLKDVAPHLLA